MREGIHFHNIVCYTLYDKEGNVKDKGEYYNQVQNLSLEEVIDAIDGGTFGWPVYAMGIGTGTGQGYSDSALATKVSDEDTVNVQSGTPEATVTCTSTFTALASWTITEAGLFPMSASTSSMLFYNDSLSVSMVTDDTLQIDWAVSAAST